MLMTAIPVNSL